MPVSPARARGTRSASKSKPKRWNGSGLAREEQHERKRLAILHAAAKIFVDRGYHETSLADIAASLGVTKPTLYYYVASKEEMLAQIATAALTQTEAHFAEAAQCGRDALDTLRLFMRVYVRSMDSDFGRCLLAARHMRLATPTQQRLTAGFRRIDACVRELLERGARDGSMRATDARMATFVVYGAINWVPHWFRADGALGAEEAGEAIFDIVASGLAKRRPAVLPPAREAGPAKRAVSAT
jgi:AcrR family transcriptional regulator